MNYGLPYMGSKSRIAEWVIDTLPAGDTFVDLFAGGCAVTHAAMLSGKYQRFIANDIGAGPQIFADAIKGEFEGYSMVASREEFFKTDDPVIKLLYSFGTDQRTYAYSSQIEKVKVPAQRMISAPSMYERRKYYREFIKALSDYLKDGDSTKDSLAGLSRMQSLESLQSLQSLQRLQRLENLQGMQSFERLDVSQLSYQLVEIPQGGVVYCDPPYKYTKASKRYTDNDFDYDAFERWLDYVPFQVFVSEYDAPRGCVEIARKERVVSMAAKTTGKVTEKIFTQERFYKFSARKPTRL